MQTPGALIDYVFSYIDTLTTGQSLGLSTSGLVGTGDHNGDGNPDLIVGKSGWNQNGSLDNGVVYVITIGGGIIQTIQPPSAFATGFFGHDVIAYHQLESGRQLVAIIDQNAGRLYLYR